MSQSGLVNKWVQDEVGKLRSTKDSGPGNGRLSVSMRKVATRRLSIDHLQVRSCYRASLSK